MFANKSLGDMLCEVPGKLSGTPFSDHVVPDDQRRVKDLLAYRIVDLRLQATDDSRVWVRCSAFPLVEEACSVVVLQNIEDLKQAEIASARLAAIVESSDDAIISKTLEGIITSWNDSAERIFGYSRDEAIGKPITLLLPEERLHEEETILSKLRRGERVDHFETVRKAKDGRLLDISVTISPIRNSAGELVGASKVARVITDRKLADAAIKLNEESLKGLTAVLEQNVRERTLALEAALTEMEGFTYTISHDLRAPLRAIIANCRMLEEEFGTEIPEAAQQHLDRQVKAANRLAQLIDDLLRLSRIGRQHMRKVELDLTAMLSDLASESDADFQIEDGLRVTGDPTLLRIAFENLIDNAVKYAKPGQRPSIEIGREDGEIYVRDNGIGFEQEYAEKVFLPFERLHREEEYPGTGVGLANVKRIVQRHGGTVSISSRSGVGTTVRIRL